MKIVSFKICPFVQRVTALLEAKNISYEVEYISLDDKPQWFLDISPNGQVPILITDGGQALFESDAIVEYLEDAFPALQPGLRPEEKAVNRAWSYLATKHYLVQCSAQRSPDAATLAERSAKLQAAFQKMEKRMADGAFEEHNFEETGIGMVEVAWLVLLHRAEIIRQRVGYDFLGDRPHLKAWSAKILASGLAEKSVAPDFEDAFARFYLSDQTYLGHGQTVDKSSFGNVCATDACC